MAFRFARVGWLLCLGGVGALSAATLMGADAGRRPGEGPGAAAREASSEGGEAEDAARFTWSPPHGYVFAEGSCGSDDQTLGWMAPVAPGTLREAKLIMFSRGESWAAQFEETSGHFVDRWMKLKGAEVVVVPGDHGRPKNRAIRVRVPQVTSQPAGTLEEAMYLQGYAGGYMDFMNESPWSTPPVAGARGKGWAAGWGAARRASGVR